MHTHSRHHLGRSRPRLSRTLASLLLAAVIATPILANQGCTSTYRPGITTVNGAYQRLFDADLPAVHDAAQKTLNDFGYTTTTDRPRRIEARSRDAVSIIVSISPSGPQTAARVRVTPGNDETLALATLDRIEQELAAHSPPR